MMSLSCFLLAYTQNKFFSIILIVIVEISFSMCEPLSIDLQNKSILTKDRATMLSIYAMIGDVIAVVVNALIGKVARLSLKFSFMLCGVLSLIALVSAVIYFSKIKNIKVSLYK